MTFSGWGAGLNLSVGGSPIPNLSIGGIIGGNLAINPELSIENGRSLSLDDITYSVFTLGAFINYYMPWNFFVTLSPMLTTINLEEDDDSLESDFGFGLRLEVGKEWWVSSNWGLGLSAYFLYSRNNLDDDIDIKMNTYSGGLMLSVTYN